MLASDDGGGAERLAERRARNGGQLAPSARQFSREAPLPNTPNANPLPPDDSQLDRTVAIEVAARDGERAWLVRLRFVYQPCDQRQHGHEGVQFRVQSATGKRMLLGRRHDSLHALPKVLRRCVQVGDDPQFAARDLRLQVDESLSAGGSRQCASDCQWTRFDSCGSDAPGYHGGHAREQRFGSKLRICRQRSRRYDRPRGPCAQRSRELAPELRECGIRSSRAFRGRRRRGSVRLRRRRQQ
jgi:hypothetical protein